MLDVPPLCGLHRQSRSMQIWVYYVDGHGKFRGRIDDLGLEPEALGDIYYKFGANEMHIGYGIKHVLEELEDLYGLDFVKLEAERKAKAQK